MLQKQLNNSRSLTVLDYALLVLLCVFVVVLSYLRLGQKFVVYLRAPFAVIRGTLYSARDALSQSKSIRTKIGHPKLVVKASSLKQTDKFWESSSIEEGLARLSKQRQLFPQEKKQRRQFSYESTDWPGFAAKQRSDPRSRSPDLLHTLHLIKASCSVARRNHELSELSHRFAASHRRYGKFGVSDFALEIIFLSQDKT